MSLDNLPVEWNKVEISAICDPKQYKTIPISELTADGYIVYGANGIIGKYSKFTHANSTLMITCRGATCGNLHISQPYSYINGNAMALDNVSGHINLRYLYFCLKARGLDDVISGSAQPQITRQNLVNAEIVISSVAEQQEIVRQLDVMLAQVEQIKARLDAIPAILKKFRQSVLADAVSGKLTEEWRNNQADISSWTFGELREFIEKPIYGTSAKSSKSGEVPVLRMGNLQNGEIDWSDLVYTSDATEIKKYDLKLNDLLFNRTNSPELVGKTSIYRGNRDAVFAGYLIRVRCLPSLDPEFLNYHLNSHIGREYCYRVKTDGVSQSNINAQKLLAYPLNCPPVNEQKIIVKLVKQYLELIHRIEEIIRSAQKRVNLLTQSILGKAFSGELTAEWREQHQQLITGINSAESLLAKIQAEREASKPVKKAKKVK